MQTKKTVTVALSAPIKDASKGEISTITIREPGFSDFMLLGEPHSFGRSPTGVTFTTENSEIVKAYIERLVDCDPLALSQLALADTLKLREALHGFFENARPEPSKT